MRVSPALAFFAYVGAEALLLYWVYSAFGLTALVGLLAAGFLLGLLAMRIAGIQAFRSLADAQQRAAAFGVRAADGSEQVVIGKAPSKADLEATTAEVGASSMLFVAGILLAAPGVISDVAGLLLLLPAVRRGLVRRIGRSIPPPGRSTRITVVAADESGWTAQQWTSSTRPSSTDSGPGGGPVIRGEILPPKDADPEQDH